MFDYHYMKKMFTSCSTGSETAIQKQLDEILKWTKEFREETNKSTDNIMFDMLCGDFNFDNISPGIVTIVTDHIHVHTNF